MHLARGNTWVLGVILLVCCDIHCATATASADSLPPGGSAGAAAAGGASAPPASGLSPTAAVWGHVPQGTWLSHLMSSRNDGSSVIATRSSGREPMAAQRQRGAQAEAEQLLGAALLAAAAGSAAVWHDVQDSRPPRQHVDPSLRADGEVMQLPPTPWLVLQYWCMLLS
jgi:hypothetical protein